MARTRVCWQQSEHPSTRAPNGALVDGSGRRGLVSTVRRSVLEDVSLFENRILRALPSRWLPGVNYCGRCLFWVKIHNKLPDVPANESIDRTQPILGVLQPGTTCWQMPRADRMAVIIDASDYFLHLKTVILQAEHSILLVGWDFDARIELDRTGETSTPNRIGQLLNHALRRNPALRIYVLRWDLAFLKIPFRGTTPFFLLDWLGGNRLHFHLDQQHPPVAVTVKRSL